MRNCPYCGTPIKETNWGRKWCPNCGIIEEEMEIENGKEKGYIR